MLVFSEEDIIKLADHDELIAVIEKAFIRSEKDDFFMPDRQHIKYNGKVLLLMPCFTKKFFITKMISEAPANVNKGLPTLYGTLMLNDGSTGQPLAVMNGSIITAIRTAAVSAVAARHTVPEDIRTVGLIGAGVQGYYQARFVCREKKAANLLVFDLNASRAETLAARTNQDTPGINALPVTDTRELVKKSELIITATYASMPVFPDELKLIQDKHFIAIGSYKPEMREIPNTVFRELTQLFIDTEHAIEESGELKDPLRRGCIKRYRIITLGKLINGEVELNPRKPSLFKSVGMALFDLATAKLIYKKALVEGVGTSTVF